MTTDLPITQVVTTLESLVKVVESLMPGAKHIAIQDYALLNDAPLAARQMIDELKQTGTFRIARCLEACHGIPDDQLRPDMVKDLRDLHPDLANYLETCMETFRHDFDDTSGSLLIRLNALFPEKDHAESPDQY